MNGMSGVEQLIKITSAGTISIPKDFRRYLDLQKGDYVKVIVEGDRLVVKKATIS
jgi:AbrB family looped-hinge helix DNA binding protein